MPVDAYLVGLLEATEPLALREALSEALLLGGAWGGLMREAAKMLGLDEAQVIPAAAAVEMVHSAALLLDVESAAERAPLADVSAVSLVSRALWLVGVATVQAGAAAESAQLALERLSEAIGIEGLASGVAGRQSGDADWDRERVAECTRGRLAAAAMGIVADLAGVVPATAATLIEFGRRLGVALEAQQPAADPLAVLDRLGSRASRLAGAARDYLERDRDV